MTGRTRLPLEPTPFIEAIESGTPLDVSSLRLHRAHADYGRGFSEKLCARSGMPASYIDCCEF